MPVMNIRPVGMGVLDGFMHMEMVMPSFGYFLLMLVEVVLVVLMWMGMREPLVPVVVAMPFSIEKKHP